VRRACVPASNGIMNARSIARHYAALVGNGVDGVKLLKEETLDAATRGSKLLNAAWGLGYGLQGPEDNRGAVFGHGGYGGSSGFADRRLKLGVGVAKSRMSGGAAVEQIVAEIRKCLA
jgi:CubicO group peptidase (beta-lactamase class C family)